MSFHDTLARWSEWGWPLIANHLWQATLVFLFALAAAQLLKRGAARARYIIWLIVSLKLVVPSILVVFLMSQAGIKFPALFDPTAPPASVNVIYKVAEPLAQNEESSVTSAELVRGHNEIYCAMTAVWFTGSAAFFVMWWRRRRRFSIAIRAGEVMSRGREFETLERVREWLALRRPVKLALTPKLIEPGVWRVWHPVIVLPREMPDHLTDGELEAVMMHEMIHIARHDNLTNSLQMFFCCLLWFNPIVWLVDRKILAEREQSCDEQVIDLSGASQVYASSLLKVFRFCLGSKVAGVSYATGSNLRRRIEQIMAENTDRKFTLSHRILVVTIAAIVIVFSIAAGLFSRGARAAQQSSNTIIESGGPTDGIPGGVPGGVIGGVPGGVMGGVPGGIPGGIPGGVPGEEGQRKQVPPPSPQLSNFVLELLERAPETTGHFHNRDDAPLAITDAKVKWAEVSIPASNERPAQRYYAIKPKLLMVNNSDRQIESFMLRFVNKDFKIHFVTLRPKLKLQPRETYTLGGPEDDTVFYASNMELFESLVAEVIGVFFEDKGTWGRYPPLPPPPPRGESADALKVPFTLPDSSRPPDSSSDAVDGVKSIRVSGGKLMTSAIKHVNPEYPPIAKAANASGIVMVEVLINEQGVVISARAVSGHPLLQSAAVDAARQWEFPPTTLSGEPVRVIGTITFNFNL